MGKSKAKRDWTIMFSNKHCRIYPICVDKFKNYWFSNFPSVRLILRTFEHVLNAISIIAINYTEGPYSTNDITIQIIPDNAFVTTFRHAYCINKMSLELNLDKSSEEQQIGSLPIRSLRLA